MKPVYYSSKKLYLYFTLLFVLFGIVIAIATSATNYVMSQRDSKKQIQEYAFSEFKYKSDYLKEYVLHLERMIDVIASNIITKQFLEVKGQPERERLNAFFIPAVYANKDITQFRLIDENGYENIRMERQGDVNNIVVIPPNDLQYKGHRGYFMESSKLKEGQFWHSKIDLNIENGKIEIPFKPTFRVSTPVYLNGVFKGIIIANLHINSILDKVITSPNFDVYLYDKDGEILVSPKNEESWSRYVDNGVKIDTIFPQYSEIFTQDHQFINNSFLMFPLSDIFKNGNNIRILMLPKVTMLDTLKKANYFTAYIIAIIVILITLPLSWIVSIVPSRLQRNLIMAFSKIRKFNNIIDKNIPTIASDIHGTIIDISPRMLELTGYTRSELVGQKQNFLKHPDTTDEFSKNFWQTISIGKVWEGEIKIKTKSGDALWLQQTVTPEVNELGEVIAYTSIAQDITDKKYIEELSMRDKLTGLFNRHKLDIVIASEQERFNRYGSNFCAILIDADHFKTINDTYGHQVGDDVLVKLSKLMRENTRRTDFCGRWGGEEFLIIAAETDTDHAYTLAEKLRTIIETESFGVVENLTVSIGISQYRKGDQIPKFINRADEALYRAKQTGRNKVCLSD